MLKNTRVYVPFIIATNYKVEINHTVPRPILTTPDFGLFEPALFIVACDVQFSLRQISLRQIEMHYSFGHVMFTMLD